MKALVKPKGPIGLDLETLAPIPDVGPHDVLIQVQYASVCGTDLHIYKSDASIRDRVDDRLIIGHEFCGEVIQVGSQVTTLIEGDIVASESHISCGTCYQCQNNKKHLCDETLLLGVDRPGGLAEFVSLPADNAIPVPRGIPKEIAAFMDAYGNAVDTATRFQLIGESVLITGCGPQGLMAIAIAVESGARQIIATDVSEVRLNMAKKIIEDHISEKQAKSRKDLYLNVSKPSLNLIEEVYRSTYGIGADVFLEMSGAPSAIRSGFAALKNGGKAAILGLPSDTVKLKWADMVFKGIEDVSFRYGRVQYNTWTLGKRLLEFGNIRLDSLVHQPFFALEDHKQAFELLINGEAAKVIFKINS